MRGVKYSLAATLAVLIGLQVSATTKVACIGDSITYGYGLPERDVNSYPAQLQKLLDAKEPGKYEVRNFGNSGRGIYLDSMRGNEKRGFRYMPEHKAALDWKPDSSSATLASTTTANTSRNTPAVGRADSSRATASRSLTTTARQTQM